MRRQRLADLPSTGGQAKPRPRIGLVWSGGGQGESLAALKWSDILKGEVQGDIRTGGGEYVWQARYLGQIELVYLTDAREVRAAKPEPKPLDPTSACRTVDPRRRT